MGRHREFDVAESLDKAMKVFWSKGYEGASISDLTEAMGINSPSLYAAFGSKEGLFTAVLNHYDSSRSGLLTRILAEPTAAKVALSYLCGVVEFATDKHHPPGCLLVQAGLSCGDLDIPRALARHRAGVELALRERFECAKRQCDLPGDVKPADLARYLLTVANGICVQAASGAHREELRSIVSLALAGFPMGPAKHEKSAGKTQQRKAVRTPELNES